MAVTSIMTTETEIDAKLGAGVDTNFTETMKDAAVLQAESLVNCATRFNWSDQVTSGVNADVLGLLSDTVSSLVAIQGIAYNLSGEAGTGFASRIIAEDMINVLRDGVLRNLSILRDKKSETFMIGEGS